MSMFQTLFEDVRNEMKTRLPDLPDDSLIHLHDKALQAEEKQKDRDLALEMEIYKRKQKIISSLVQYGYEIDEIALDFMEDSNEQ